MSEAKKTYLFRMTHIENIPHIMANGITHKNSLNSNPNFKPIGDASLISHRNRFILDNGKELGEYIPFYFGTRMPMLYVVQNGFNGVKPQKPDNIVYCVTSVVNIVALTNSFIFTDGHATDKLSKQYTYKNIGSVVELIDWDAVNTYNWNNPQDLDLKRRMQAEFLVENDIPFSAILGYITYNDLAKDKLIKMGLNKDKIKASKGHYF